MALVAQRLKVIPVPKLFHIAFMRNDMVNVCGGNIEPTLQALNTKRILSKESLSAFLPCVSVSA